MTAPGNGVFRTLRRRNFRLFLAGQLVSNCGTWMQNVALAWLVLQVSHSPLAVGLVSSLQFLPSLLFGAYGGVVADRFAKRRVLVLTQSGMAAAAAALAVLALTGQTALWALYLVTFVSGLFQAMDMPVRQAFISEMVGVADLPNAVGLNSAMFNLTRIGGPALGALVINLAGVGECFVLNALSYLAVISALLAMSVRDLFPSRRAPHAKGQVREGLRYVWGTPRLRQALVLLAVAGTLAFNFNTVLPVLAKDDFRGDAGTYALDAGIDRGRFGRRRPDQCPPPPAASRRCGWGGDRHGLCDAGGLPRAQPPPRGRVPRAARVRLDAVPLDDQFDLPAGGRARDEGPRDGCLRRHFPGLDAPRRDLDRAGGRGVSGHAGAWRWAACRCCWQPRSLQWCWCAGTGSARAQANAGGPGERGRGRAPSRAGSST